MSVLADMANDRYSSRLHLWLDKMGHLAETEINSAIEWGILLEPVVRDWFARTHLLDVRRAGMFRRPDLPYVHANPDGLVVANDGVITSGVEIKTTGWRQAGDWADDQVPDHAELQAQVNMAVIGVDTWWVVGLIDGRNPQVRLIDRDQALIDMILPLAETFFRDHVIPGEPPSIDGSIATSKAVRAWLAHVDPCKAVALTDEMVHLFQRLDSARMILDGAERTVRETESALRVAIGDAEVLVDRLPTPDDPDDFEPDVLATYPNNGTFSPKRFTAALPELAAEFTVDRPTLDVTALKLAHPDLYRAHCARVLRPRRKALSAVLAARTQPGGGPS